MRKVLDLGEPIITSYPPIADLFSILGTNANIAKQYLSNNFINLTTVCWEPEDQFHMGYFSDMLLESFGQNCNLLSYKNENRHYAMREYEKLTDYIEEMIINDYYLSLLVNSFFLPCSPRYRKEHFMHNTFIYGFDRDLQQIMVADFYYHGKYTRETVSYEEINKGYKFFFHAVGSNKWSELENSITKMKFLECDNNPNIEIDIGSIKMQICDYLNSSNKAILNAHSVLFRGKMSHGLSYYESLLYMLNNNPEYLDKRLFYILLDHKKAWSVRTEVLYEKYNYNSSKYHDIQNGIYEMQKSSQMLLNMVLKYNYFNSTDLFERIMGKLVELRDEDEKVTHNIMELL